MASAPRKRAYNSPTRTAAAQEKREGVLAAARQLLARVENVGAFTLEAVAQASGVTRLTVYHQFGSRRALMEAVLDRIATDAGVMQLPALLDTAAPLQALEATVRTLCRFWQDPAVMRLQDAAATDAEFGQALQQRHERRRQWLGVLVERIAPQAPRQARRDTTDLLTALTGPQTFRVLSHRRSPRAVAALVADACANELRRAALA